MDRLFEPARMTFCEPALDGLIQHPADVWTNIGPFIAGLVILWRARCPLERLLGAAAVWTAVASAYFHARSNLLGESLDLSGMFLFILSAAALQQRRQDLYKARHAHGPGSIDNGSAKHVSWATNRVLVVLVISLTVVLTLLSAWSTLFASPAFAVIVVAVCLRELFSDFHLQFWGRWLVATLLVAWGFWWLDYLHLLCSPSNHILTAHGVWHLLNGLVFYFTWLHFTRDTTPRHSLPTHPSTA